METSLHRQLKSLYAGRRGKTEVRRDGYRIDAVRRGELIEIQHGSLAAIRDKIRRLLAEHPVRVVKPIIARKLLVKLDGCGGAELCRRLSPKRGTHLDLFDELVYFTQVFPHERLTLEIVLVEVEERRYPGRGKRRRRRRPDGEFQVEDQLLTRVVGRRRYATADDLWRLLPRRMPREFHTGELAQRLGKPRWIAQRIAYCLRQTGAAVVAGKRGNSLVYRRAA